MPLLLCHKRVSPLVSSYHFRLQDEWKKGGIELFFVEMSFFKDELQRPMLVGKIERVFKYLPKPLIY